MNAEEYLQLRVALIKDAVVTDLETEIIGNDCYLRKIHIKHPSGNEFTIESSESGLHVTQVLWGN